LQRLLGRHELGEGGARECALDLGEGVVELLV
jgi:hypothetical protein